MNKIEKIVSVITAEMQDKQATKPTVAIVYDSIISVYPKLNKRDKDTYNCYRKVIIQKIAEDYDSSNTNEIDTIKYILSRILKEC